MAAIANLRSLATHSGTFHVDEVLACSLLLFLNPLLQLTRSRDEAVLAKSDIIVDVGGVYDPSKHRYDHHQRGFTDTYEGFNTKLSSFGLIYRHFGPEALGKLTSHEPSTPLIKELQPLVYKKFVEAIDAVDNGISRYPNEESLEPRYQNNTTLAALVDTLNPLDTMDTDPAFKTAMSMAWLFFEAAVEKCAFLYIPARQVVKDALANAIEGGKIVVFNEWCDWKEHLLEMDTEKKALYVIYPTNDTWRMQAVPVKLKSFASRLPLPEKWRGLRDSELDAVKGGDHPGAVFVHASGFTGGHKTKEGAIEMAKMSIAMQQ